MYDYDVMMLYIHMVVNIHSHLCFENNCFKFDILVGPPAPAPAAPSSGGGTSGGTGGSSTPTSATTTPAPPTVSVTAAAVSPKTTVSKAQEFLNGKLKCLERLK